MSAILAAPPVAGSLPPTAATTAAEPEAVAVAVGEGVRGPPLITVTSGLAVTLGVGLGASTHLVTLAPLAAAVVVQKEPWARALGASTNTPTRHNEVIISNLLTTPPTLGRWLWTANLNETSTKSNTNLPKKAVLGQPHLHLRLLSQRGRETELRGVVSWTITRGGTSCLQPIRDRANSSCIPAFRSHRR
jgi:hypothetical protein